MKIVQAHTGARAVPVPDEGVILVDPEIGHNTAVNAIQACLPDAHPDAVEHWVEAVLPTADPLTETLSPTEIQQARQFYRPERPVEIKPGRHRMHHGRRTTARPAKVAARVGALVATGVLGAMIPTLLGGSAPAAAEDSWTQPVFATASQAGWQCDPAGPQVAQCVNEEGIPFAVETENGPSSRAYYFRYADPVTGEEHRNTMRVFKTPEAERDWVKSKAKVRRNVQHGKGWVAYGSDGRRLDRYGKFLKEKLG